MIRGKAWKFGDDINTDVMTHGGVEHCLEEVDPDFPKKLKPGDVVVAGRNFGCGSSRQSAPENLRHLGVGCVIASSFARIFLRNAINIGLPVVECPQAAGDIDAGDTVEIDIDSGKIKDLTKNKEYQASAFPQFMRAIIADGGLINYARKKLGVA